MKTVWEKYNEAEMKACFEFNEGYKKYISECKTERECTIEAIEIAKKYGFVDLNDLIKKGTKLNPGDKVYVNNRDKNLCLFVMGKKPLSEGMNILGAHIDSPRLDLKQKPL